MRVPDELLRELQQVGPGPTMTVVHKILRHLLNEDLDDLVNQPLDPIIQGKARRCKELIKLFTPKSEG